jgi:glycosyltransferase involved in cell wall biosynthesis
MIRVLHVIDTGGPGGAETVFLQTATRLDPARFESTAVVGGFGWLAEQFQKRGAPPQIAPAKGSFNVRYLSALLRLARQHKSDVIVAHLYGSSVYASMVGRLLSIPVVSVLHGHSDVPEAERFSFLKAAILRGGSRKVVFVSERLEQHLQPRFGLTAAQCAIIPNGVDTEAFRPARDRSLRAELGIPDDTSLIGAIGNVRKPKAYDVLLHAARTLIDRAQRFHLVIAGDCANALGGKLEQLRRDLGIERQVTFLGLRPDVPRILNNLDVFALSSLTEGFSIACVEAMACGVPVVATRSGGPEQILEGEAGLLVPTGDPQSLALAIERVISSEELAAMLTARATKRVHEQYSLATMLSRYEELLERVAQRPTSSR